MLRALVEETYAVIQDQQGWQSLQAIWPDVHAHDPLTVIRHLALAYERRRHHAPSGLVMSTDARLRLCQRGVYTDRIAFSTGGMIRSLPLYLTADWEDNVAFQVASEKRLGAQMLKGEILPLKDIPPPVRRSFESYFG